MDMFENDTHSPVIMKCYLYSCTVCALLNLLTPRSRVLLEKLISSQLVKKFTAFYGMQRFIHAFTGARHLSLSWDRSIQSIPPHPTSWESILISFHLCLRLPSGFFPSSFLTQTYMHLASPLYVLHAPPISFFSTWSLINLVRITDN